MVLISINFIFFGGDIQNIKRENIDEVIELIYSPTECFVPTYDAMVFIKKYRDLFDKTMLKSMEDIFNVDLNEVHNTSGFFMFL